MVYTYIPGYDIIRRDRAFKSTDGKTYGSVCFSCMYIYIYVCVCMYVNDGRLNIELFTKYN